MDSYIKGTFKKFIFQSDKNYVIGLFRVKDSSSDMEEYNNKTITITGYFHELTIDESYIMYGELVNNPRYGMQYNVSDYERVVPEGKEAVISFLSSGLFPGVGEKSAELIVNTLGDNALELIEEDVNNLLLVPKMTIDKATKIRDILLKYNESYNTIVYLNNMGFTNKDSMTIYNFYRNDTLDKINNNVYSITDDINEISFIKIEKIRKRLNIDDLDKNRILYAIIYTMNSLCFSRGDTYLYIEDILEYFNRIMNLEFTLEELELYLYELQKNRRVKILGKKYFLTEYFNAEVNSELSAIAGGIVGRNTGEGNIDRCINIGKISAASFEYEVAGGIVGDLENGIVTLCNNRGHICVTNFKSPEDGYVFTSQKRSYVGGIVGGQSSTLSQITKCISSGNLEFLTGVEGLYCGEIIGAGYTDLIEDCYYLNRPEGEELFTLSETGFFQLILVAGNGSFPGTDKVDSTAAVDQDRLDEIRQQWNIPA